MKPTMVDGVTGGMQLEEFSCAEGVGVSIHEGGSKRGTVRLADDKARQFVTNMAARLGGVVLFGEPKPA